MLWIKKIFEILTVKKFGIDTETKSLENFTEDIRD